MLNMTSTKKKRKFKKSSLLKSHIKTVIDDLYTLTYFNFGRHEDLSTPKSNIYLGLAVSVNVTFSGR